MSSHDDQHSYNNATLSIGVLDEVDSLNPYIGLTRASQLFYSLVYDGLQSLDEDLEAAPNLAIGCYAVPTTDPELQATGAPFGSVWQYNLTSNAYWTDGEQFTADDVVWNIQINANASGELWACQPSSYFMKDAVKIDESTVRIHFYDRSTGTPMSASFANMISMPMLPKHMMADLNSFDIGFTWNGVFSDTDPPIVGTGPFMAPPDIWNEWLAGDHLTLLRNPEYHAKPDRGLEVHFDKIQLVFYDDTTSMQLALTNHELDIAELRSDVFSAIVSSSQAGSLSDITIYKGLGPAQDLVYLSWLVRSGPDPLGGYAPNPAMRDPEIRKALAMATNNDYIADDIFDGLAEAATTIISPINSRWHYEPTQAELIPYNIEEAKQILEDAGYVHMDGDGVRECANGSYAVQSGLVADGTKLSFAMAVPSRSDPGIREIAEYLEEEWARVGVELIISFIDPDVLPLCPYDLDVGLVTRSGPLDPNEVLFAQSKRAIYGWSDSGYSSVQYDESYNESVTSMSYQARKAAVDECQRIHYLDLPYQNLIYPYQLYAWRDDSMQGWGNWSERPGLSIENTWGASPLLFNLVPVSCDVCPYSYTIIYTAAILCGVAGLVFLGLGLRRRLRTPPSDEASDHLL